MPCSVGSGSNGILHGEPSFLVASAQSIGLPQFRHADSKGLRLLADTEPGYRERRAPIGSASVCSARNVVMERANLVGSTSARIKVTELHSGTGPDLPPAAGGVMRDGRTVTEASSVDYTQGRRRAGFKAAATVRRRKAEASRRRRDAGRMAAATRKSPPHKARVTAKKSQQALSRWAKANAWHLVYLDSEGGNPRTGIVDAVLIRIAPKKPDVVQVRLVQLKGGVSGLKPREVTRLEAAVGGVEVSAMYALYDGTSLATMMNPRARPAPSPA